MEVFNWAYENNCPSDEALNYAVFRNYIYKTNQILLPELWKII